MHRESDRRFRHSTRDVARGGAIPVNAQVAAGGEGSGPEEPAGHGAPIDTERQPVAEQLDQPPVECSGFRGRRWNPGRRHNRNHTDRERWNMRWLFHRLHLGPSRHHQGDRIGSLQPPDGNRRWAAKASCTGTAPLTSSRISKSGDFRW